MASGVNKVMILGNLGRDPEVRYSQQGMAICNFSVAVTERVKDGEAWKDATEWFRCVTFGKTAENCAQYLAKGRQVYVEGRLRTSKYAAKDGTEKTSVEVIADRVVFVGGAPGKGESAPAAPPARGPNGLPHVDDDLPF